ncbi:glucosidase family protein [Pedobacter africanus]|uniref:Alpha-L-rhamnosidase six-hairpin glycosidase domain-containing protein n=1 Tax=Pedobacter africanus TaxID=151894 RepID=A0A1W2DDL3_9SPHI|nr:hypothetical protein [Pedobacter africanus]SMC95176.1 hypothetical protein SAMN04488524_3608 [Pedobacter africanus]
MNRIFMQGRCLIAVLCLKLTTGYAQQTLLPKQTDRWAIQPNGSITWNIDKRIPHTDHIEMAGEQVAIWVEYGLDSIKRSKINRTLVFPTFRMLPDGTRSHITYSFQDNELPRFYMNKRLLDFGTAKSGKSGNLGYNVKDINQKGIMRVNAETGNPVLATIVRSFFPSVDQPMAIEKFVFTNVSGADLPVAMEYLKREVRTDASRSKGKSHSVIMGTTGEGNRVLKPGESATFAVYYLATDHPEQLPAINADKEEQKRMARIAEIQAPLKLETPDKVLNTAFEFAKLRATESIYKTKGGYMHGPGGLAYYAAIWANDQAEYVNPYFAFSGDRIGHLSAMNAYAWFARYMNPDYKAIPSSIVAEGDAVWKGAGDRGDQAMIAYGASRYALATGNIDSARKLWPLIEWCLEYSKRKMNAEGVVTSDKDELEGRFPAGKANLSTNTLYYDALRSAVMLGQALGKPKSQTDAYHKQADALKVNMEKYFGGNVEGFETYKYYEGNDVLRAWICLPLTMGIFDRKQGTIDALFSPRLWTADGLATQAGKETFWDRSTLYALRGVLQAGETGKAMDFIKYYSRRRLLGDHVPYPVEAYPEGNQRHLSAESGLYCRIFTEGLFGMRPVGFRSFECAPRMPEDWNHMSLRSIHAFGNVFDLEVSRAGKNMLLINIKKDGKDDKYKIKEGATQLIKL